MKKLIFLLITVGFFSISFGQIKKEYQDPAIWIGLELKKDGIPVKITTINGETNYYKAPVKLVPKNTNKLLPLKISIDSITYQANDKDRGIVHLVGKVDLSCCRNKAVNLELIDKAVILFNMRKPTITESLNYNLLMEIFLKLRITR